MACLTKISALGHIEPSTYHMPQTAINSLTTQKMIDKHFQPDSFTTPLNNVLGDVRKSFKINYWRHLNHNLHKMKQALETLISLKCRLTWVTQNLSQRGHTPLVCSTMTG